MTPRKLRRAASRRCQVLVAIVRKRCRGFIEVEVVADAFIVCVPVPMDDRSRDDQRDQQASKEWKKVKLEGHKPLGDMDVQSSCCNRTGAEGNGECQSATMDASELSFGRILSGNQVVRQPILVSGSPIWGVLEAGPCEDPPPEKEQIEGACAWTPGQVIFQLELQTPPPPQWKLLQARWWDIVSPLPPSDGDHSGVVPRDKLSQLVETFAGHVLVVASVVTQVVDLQPNGIQEDSANEVDSGALHLNDAVDADSEQGGEEIALDLEPDSIVLHKAVS
ncbi:hypothetical protein MLD38_037652 [Melastoma candidum]|uniref:Uncharacterized protein n=1 Tax=Melastoma candidum TaxID=119954 RepID=A0ACB9LP14_9MYRT|nr:hypothetical protein MLD38_037652 [Melastoma candidum]